MYKHYIRGKRLFAVVLITSCITGGLFVSCKKGHPTWDANILAPIVSTNLSINNLLADTLIKVNPDTSVSLVYDGTLYDLNTDSIVKMPDTTLSYLYGYIFAGPTYVAPGNTIITNGGTTTYNISTVQLKKAIIQQGYIDVAITSYINQPTNLTYSVPCAILGSNPLNIYIKLPAKTGSSPVRVKKTYSLANYSIDFTGPSHNSFNTISTLLKAIVDSLAPGSAKISLGDSLNVIATFHGIEPYYAKGYFGTVTKTYTSQTAFPLFKKVIGGSLMMQNITVTMLLENYFGIDAQVNISQLSAVNTHTGITVSLTDAGLINHTININRGTETFSSPPVNPSLQSFSITPANSNILAWADNMPNYVGYTLQVTTDPLGNVSGSNDFAYYGYGITSHLNISVPLSLIASNLTLEDTLSVNFANNAQVQQVKSGTFTIYADNGFPFSAGLQIYLLDDNMKIVDSLMVGPQTIAAGIMNVSGIVVSPQNSVLIANIPATRMQTLLNAKHIIVLSKFNMGSNPPPVYRKIYSYYQLSVKLVGNFDYQFKG